MRQQAENRVQSNKDTDTDIIWNLQEILAENNSYVRISKYALEAEPSPGLIDKVDSEMRSSAEDTRQYNIPKCNEVAWTF